MKPLTFIDEHGSFTMKNPENTSYLYFPLASENGLKSAVTPNLGGDAKIDQETFLLEPVSAENLHNNRSTRNFWCVVESVGAYSAAGASAAQEAARFTPGQDESELSAGFMWHTLRRVSKSFQLESNVTTFLPKDSNVEIHYITVRNLSARPQRLIPYGAIPIYGRSADNIRDHRNVTSMLHRIRVTQNGVLVQPTMSFDEKGHRPNHKIYYVCGFTGTGGTPERFYPTVEEFLGEGGTYTHPRTLYDIDNGVSAFSEAEGKEAMGAFRFPGIMLEPGQTAEYILLAGAADSTEEIDRLVYNFTTEHGGIPAPLHYDGFPKSVCTSLNNVICHGIPSEYEILREGDILNVDVSTILDGYFSDASRMFTIGNISPEAAKLVRVTQECVDLGLKAAKPWGHLGDIAYAINTHAQKHGYSVVEDIGGHGIGLDFHEEPFVSYVTPKCSEMVLVPGMMFTIEPMVNEGSPDFFVDEDDDWTVYTIDDGLSAQVEYMVLVTETGIEVLTK